MRVLVVLPTYKEVSTIDDILRLLLSLDFVDILVVDDGSPDGTAIKVKDWCDRSSKVFLIERPSKLGLGTAYVTGFKWGLERNYDLFFEMDADLSHDPAMIPYFADQIEKGYEVVIGSRYMKGTISVVGWDFKRLLLSKFANYYVRLLTPLKDLTDVTSGFRCYKKEVLQAIDLDRIRSNGYAFQIEMAYKAFLGGFRILEIPIIFYERNGGSSKMSRKIALEAAWMVWRLKFQKWFE